MANKLIQDLGATVAVLSTDLWEKQPVAGPPSEKATIAQLITLLDTIYTQASGGPYLPLAGGTMVGNILFSADNTRDIGASGATRPRTGYWGTSLVSPLLDSPAATALSLASAGTTRANFSTAGHLLFNTDNTNDIGATGATRPRTGYFGTSVISPLFTGALTGAASLNVLKAGDTMTGALLFSADNTVDIGASAATRPRTGYFGTSVVSPLLNIGSALITSDAANVLAQRSGTNPQTLNLYRTFTDASNYRRMSIYASGNGIFLETQSAGTGTQMDLNLSALGVAFVTISTAGTMRWIVNNNGHFIANADNSYDIGASAVSRPRTVYIGTSLIVPAITMGVAGKLSITSGTNQRAGNATLVGGTITVANTTVTANTVIMLTRKTSGGTIGTAITYTVSAATSFTINSDSVVDTSTFSYLLIEVP